MRTITVSLPWDHVVWDLIGKLPTSENHYKPIHRIREKKKSWI